MTKTLDAIQRLERLATTVSGIIGTVLRYGSLYGPGTSISRDGEIVKLLLQRKFPVIGNGAGVWSFIHVDDAANAAKIAIDSDTSGVFNIVDDEPAPVSVWPPALADAIGAKLHTTYWLGLGDSSRAKQVYP
jgi:2-alkyl-3-oxoalkanoate reductase